MPSGNIDLYRDQLDDLRQSQVNWTPYHGSMMRVMPPICFERMNIWTARVPLISWRRVEWHLPDRVARQFGGAQSTNIQPIEQKFDRVDGRGRADEDWMTYYVEYITLWNHRMQFIVPISAPEGNGEEELHMYMQWYRSWAKIFLLKTSAQPPRTYHQSAPDHRIVHDYIMETQRILGPLIGRHGENASSLQLAVDEVGALTRDIRHKLHMDEPLSRAPEEWASTYHFAESQLRGPQIIGETSRAGAQRTSAEAHRHSSFTGIEEFAQMPNIFARTTAPEEWASTSQQTQEPHFTLMPSMENLQSFSWNPAEHDIMLEPTAPSTSHPREQEDSNIQGAQRRTQAPKRIRRIMPSSSVWQPAASSWS